MQSHSVVCITDIVKKYGKLDSIMRSSVLHSLTVFFSNRQFKLSLINLIIRPVSSFNEHYRKQDCLVIELGIAFILPVWLIADCCGCV